MAAFIDVCNGDVDGLCAVVQWRLHAAQPARLVTGLKRDIGLLEQVRAGPGRAGRATRCWCDLSMQRNPPALQRLLADGARVRYFDHHAVRVSRSMRMCEVRFEGRCSRAERAGSVAESALGCAGSRPGAPG